MRFLKSNTSKALAVGPFVAESDGKTLVSSLTIAAADVKISKDGAAFVSATSGGSFAAAYLANGFYSITLNAADLNFSGALIVSIKMATALSVWHEFAVLPAQGFNILHTDGTALDLKLKSIAVVNNGGDAVQFTSTGANGNGFVVQGFGSGSGEKCVGGSSGGVGSERIGNSVGEKNTGAIGQSNTGTTSGVLNTGTINGTKNIGSSSFGLLNESTDGIGQQNKGATHGLRNEGRDFGVMNYGDIIANYSSGSVNGHGTVSRGGNVAGEGLRLESSVGAPLHVVGRGLIDGLTIGDNAGNVENFALFVEHSLCPNENITNLMIGEFFITEGATIQNDNGVALDILGASGLRIYSTEDEALLIQSDHTRPDPDSAVVCIRSLAENESVHPCVVIENMSPTGDSVIFRGGVDGRDFKTREIDALLTLSPDIDKIEIDVSDIRTQVNYNRAWIESVNPRYPLSGILATQSDIQNIQNNTNFVANVPTVIPRPVSAGFEVFRVDVAVYDESGSIAAVKSNAVNCDIHGQGGSTFISRMFKDAACSQMCDAVNASNKKMVFDSSTGTFYFYFKVDNGLPVDSNGNLSFVFTYANAANKSFIYYRTATVIDGEVGAVTLAETQNNKNIIAAALRQPDALSGSRLAGSIINELLTKSEGVGNDVKFIVDKLPAGIISDLSKSSMFDGVTLEGAVELLLALVNGRYELNYPTTGDLTFFKRNGTTVLTTVHITDTSRTRVL